MTISQLRRKLNDSHVGEKVNGSIPGILIEGLSRAVSDALNYVKYEGMILGASLIGRKRPLAGLALGGMTFVEALVDSIKDVDPETHYSHKSPLYEMTTDSSGGKVMDRVPVQDALLKKIAQYSPETALNIALATAQPELRYRRPDDF
ncbi:hypothetical protein GOV06_02155 [Candidatus Woesearchaeota archaeon]|nr:hypothetical protein [Candidatus Woesearchaeota archaeon]